MKITVWIRHDAEGNATMRVDAKYEDRDTPRIQNFGRRLMKAKLAAAARRIESEVSFGMAVQSGLTVGRYAI